MCGTCTYLFRKGGKWEGRSGVERREEGSGEGKHFGLGAGWGKWRRWNLGVDVDGNSKASCGFDLPKT